MKNKLLLSMLLTSSLIFSNCATTAYIAPNHKDAKMEEKINNHKHSNLEYTNNSTLKILDGNLWGLPQPFSVDKGRRLDTFLSLVHKYDPDIVCLQEVWLKKDLRKIRESLKEYDMYTSDKGTIYNYSGLAVFSKYSVAQSEFHKFDNPNKNLVESLSNKGYLKITLAGTDINIIDTHLYSPRDSSERNIAYSQFEIVKNAAKGGIEILVGDFNMPKKDIDRLNDGQFMIEKDTTYTYNPENRYVHLGANASTKDKGSKIDYIMMKADNKNSSIASELIKTPVSDHYMMNYKLNLSDGVFLYVSEKLKQETIVTR